MLLYETGIALKPTQLQEIERVTARKSVNAMVSIFIKLEDIAFSSTHETINRILNSKEGEFMKSES